jgi:hypothetical protein
MMRKSRGERSVRKRLVLFHEIDEVAEKQLASRDEIRLLGKRFGKARRHPRLILHLRPERLEHTVVRDKPVGVLRVVVYEYRETLDPCRGVLHGGSRFELLEDEERGSPLAPRAASREKREDGKHDHELPDRSIHGSSFTISER